jgi:hypothetical protein
MSDMGRWVDPRVEKVRLASLSAYLLGHGWRLRPFSQPQLLVFEEPVQGSEEPVVQLLPASEQARDFRRSVIDAITSLSALEERHPVAVLEEVLRQSPRDQPGGPNSSVHSGDVAGNLAP